MAFADLRGSTASGAASPCTMMEAPRSARKIRERDMIAWRFAALLFVIGSGLGASPSTRAEDVTLNVWSHEADEDAKVAFRELAAKNLEAAHPGVHVKITWYEKNPSRRSEDGVACGTRPRCPLCRTRLDGVCRSRVSGAARRPDRLEQHRALGTRGLGVQWQDLWRPARGLYERDYYNKDLLKKLGVELPANAQFTQSQFLDLVKKAKAAGITPIAQGVGDRPFPGAYILGEALLRKLGKEDYRKLWTGSLSFEDPRVVDVFKWTKELVDAGAYPKNFMTLKLGELHYYFYTKPGALMLPMGSWTRDAPSCRRTREARPRTSRLESCSIPRWMAARATSARPPRSAPASPSTRPASTRMSPPSSSTPCRHRRWANAGSRPSIYRPAIKADVKSFSGPYAAYFTELMERQKGADYFIGGPRDLTRGECKDSFAQVMNSAFPGGLLPVDQAIKMMNAACFKG